MNKQSPVADYDAAACDIYDQPGQDCFTAGNEVIASEGLCGPCSMRLLARVTPPTESAGGDL